MIIIKFVGWFSQCRWTNCFKTKAKQTVLIIMLASRYKTTLTVCRLQKTKQAIQGCYFDIYLCFMNFIDIIILIPLAYAAWVGFKKGFIIEVFTLLALFVGLYAGIHFSEFVSNGLKKSFSWDSDYLPTISFTLTFLAVGAMVYFAGKALEKIVKFALLSPFNKIAGIIFALLKGSYIISVILLLLSSYDKENKFIPLKAKNESLLYYPMLKLSSATIPGFKESFLFEEKQDANDVNLTVDQVIRAKEIADSLGIDTKDVVELNEIYQKYEIKK